MLLAVVQENDPVYQLCEESINNYIDTLDESYLAAYCEMSDKEMYDLLHKRSENGPKDTEEGYINAYRRDGLSLSKNPFIAWKKIMDMNHDFPSRAQAIGVHQPQKRMVADGVLMYHPNTKPMLVGALATPLVVGATKGLKNIYDYEHKPVGLIARKIASLRKVLSKIKNKINSGGILPKQKNILQKVAIKVTEAIDKLLKFAQKASSNFSREFAKK